jgi:hypothetical protein
MGQLDSRRVQPHRLSARVRVEVQYLVPLAGASQRAGIRRPVHGGHCAAVAAV